MALFVALFPPLEGKYNAKYDYVMLMTIVKVREEGITAAAAAGQGQEKAITAKIVGWVSLARAIMITTLHCLFLFANDHLPLH